MSATHVCAACPKVLGASCCEAGEGKLATLTNEDVERIRTATRQAPAKFVAEEWLSHQDAAAYERERPLFRGYFRPGAPRLTLRVRGAACVFHHAERGCGLTAEIRPLACRLYPFQLLADGSWSVLPPRFGDLAEARASGDGCLAVERADGMAALQEAFSMTPEDLETLADRLRAAVRAHGRRSDR